jgi:hypothetical protein
MTVTSAIGQLAFLLTRADEQDRASARQVEDAADQAAMHDANDRVSQLRAKADADENAGLAEGIGGIAGGLCSIGAGLSAPTGSSESSGARASTLHIALTAGTQALPGAGKVFQAVFTGDSGRDNAEAARFEAQAQAQTRQFDRARSDEQAANDSIQKVEQFLDQAQQTENATRLAAATFRA